jgi:hypothetical protein
MRVFGIFRRKKEPVALTREILLEKWFELGRDAIPSMVSLIRNEIVPALKSEMELAGFDNVRLTNCPENGRSEHWYCNDKTVYENLSDKRLGEKGFDAPITDYIGFCRWATRAEKMLDKIQELRLESSEMKRMRDDIKGRVRRELKNKKK